MKKTIIILLSFILTFSCCLGIADDDTISFTTNLTSIFGEDYTTSRFLSTSENRALLSICLLIDLSNGPEPGLSSKAGTLFSHDSFVGQKDGMLTLCVYDDIYIYNILYFPSLPETGYYSKTDRNGLSESAIELAVKLVNDECYKNSLSDILSVIQTLKEAFES